MTKAEPQQPGERPPPALVFLVTAAALQRLATTAANSDLWGFLAFGRLFWETGRFPYQDVFAYTPTLTPWVYHEWLTGVLFYPLYLWTGGTGLQVLKYGLGLATFYLLSLAARLQRSRACLTLIVFLAVSPFLTLFYSPVRPQVFTYFFFALELYLLEGARQRGRWRSLWLLPPLLALWANLHGGFVAGLGLLALYLVGEALHRRPYRAYGVVLLGSGLATLINPYGLQYWTYLQGAVSMPRPYILEWAPLYNFYQAGQMPGFFLFVLLSLAVMLVLLAGWVRWRDYTGWLTLAVTAYLSLKHVRHLMFFLLALGLYGPLLLTRFAEKCGPLPRLPSLSITLKKNIVVILCSCLATLFAYQFIRSQPLSLVIPSHPEERYYYPVAAVDFVKRENLSGKILTDFTWGQYLIWQLYPACRVAFDGRYETVYPREVEEAYQLFIEGLPGWSGFLERYPPDMILIAKASRPYLLLKAEPRWREVFADAGSALFVSKEFSPNLTPAVGQ
ncbi:MAG: hypothetical protein FJ128_09500 [Deltaproteobacteria bacterium]|nr:hypothetical protein [Deltaproteobacteria bacterium]